MTLPKEGVSNWIRIGVVGVDYLKGRSRQYLMTWAERVVSG